MIDFVYKLNSCGFESRCCHVNFQMWRLLRSRSSLTFRQTIECGFTLKLVRDMIIRIRHNHLVRKRTLSHSAKVAKWFRVRLQTKWLWVRIALLSLELQIWRLLRARRSLTFRQTIGCGFTMKLVRDMIIRFIQKYGFLSKVWLFF